MLPLAQSKRDKRDTAQRYSETASRNTGLHGPDLRMLRTSSEDSD